MYGFHPLAQSLLASRRIVRPLWAIAASVTLLGVSSCATSNGTPETEAGLDPGPADSAELQVVTTFLPITQFTKAVAGERAEVVQLIPPTAGPHDYQATPGDVSNLAQADVLVKNGLEMEVFLDDLIENAGNEALVVIDSSVDIAVLSNEEVEGAGHGQEQDHGHDDHDHGHSHDEQGDDEQGHSSHAEGGHDHHGEYNPHIWLDPKRAIQQVENIRDGLIGADPDGEPEYTANAAAYIQQLEELDAEIAAQLAPYRGETLVVFHDFAPYFAESYGLEAEFLVDVPEINPSPEDVRRVSLAVEASGLKTLLTEPQAGEDSLAALAGDLGVKVSLFDPLETGGAEAMDSDYYFTTMRQNILTLTESLEDSTQSWLPWSNLYARATVAPQGQPQPVRVGF